MRTEIKHKKRYIRHKRIRVKIRGIAERPRLFAFRSNKHIYAQLIDDDRSRTLVAASDLDIKVAKPGKIMERKGKSALAYEVGKLIAQKALKNKIEKVVFDRAGYKYHGRIKALAEGAREGGLIF
ncbi:MAG: 50S ribosomal protein L18 [Candidatus Nealsonbacteria bacterium CG08_land_8_20_14_0_20_38_20]|uniref:Large ribosomal subunit protein uL18 n=1 Tax=Candidatus Nealsonbacteria bacterium CG08_land_8_20_14_0_20_38_20 TaxID=1974705 RepID=A0A2H0YMP3_9BACT|nr:MAG: 50S ribosomal protein L18 [Candidatus Nealsonbacteria bacterium CG08_land_8_20_14_0_20_38_20]